MANEEQIERLQLLDILGSVIDANSGRPTDIDWYAEGLANKFYDHALFVLKISDGATSLNLPSGTITISGVWTQGVILRAAFEAFLVFHHVYCVPKTQEDKEFKHWSYRLAGVMERKDLPATTEEQKATLASDKQVIQELLKALDSNSILQSLGTKDKKNILYGRWKLPSWSEMAEEAGLIEFIASTTYSHLCGVGHSSSLSILQATLAYEKHEEQVLMRPYLSLISILIANMVYDYCELFPSLKTVLEKDETGKKLVEMWVAIGRG